MMYYEEFIGAIKIKDGLFIGDIQAVKDYEFIITNKVSHIINAAGKQVDNLLENIGIQYLTFYWQESDSQVLFDKDIETVNQIVEFIEQANERGESCLVHSIRGQSRSCCVLTAYFMRRYQWTLLKSLDYLNSRRPDLEIRATFFDQLKNLEQYLQQTNQGAISSDWNVQCKGNDAKMLIENSPEEVLLRNTFLNAKQGQIPDYYLNMGKQQKFGGYSPHQKAVPTKIVWQDEVQNNKKKLIQVLNQSQNQGKKGQSVQYRKPSPSPFKRIHPQIQQQKQLEQQKQKAPKQQDYFDSILKGSNKIFRKETGEEINEEDINNNQEQQEFGVNRIQQNQQKQNEVGQSKSPQTRTQNKINYGENCEQNLENNDGNLLSKSLINKENSSRTGSTRDDSLLQDKHGNDQQDGNKQQIKVNADANKSQGQSQKVSIQNDTFVKNNKNQFVKGNDIVDLTDNNGFADSNIDSDDSTQQTYQIKNQQTEENNKNAISNDSSVRQNQPSQNFIQQKFLQNYSNINDPINNGSFLNSNNTSQNNKSLQESNQFSAGKQSQLQQNNETNRILNYYKQVEDKKKNDQKSQTQNQQYQISQQMMQHNIQMQQVQKYQQQQQQLANSQLQQQQQYGFSLQQNPLQIMQSQNPQQGQQNQVSNSQTLSKMLSKNNTYHQQDMAYQKAVSKSFNQSKMKQEIVFGSNQCPLPKELNNSLIKNDLTDSKITKNNMKQKHNQQPSQVLQQPLTYKYPIKANPDIFEKRPNSANILQQGRQINNGFAVLTNNFLMGNNRSNNVNENENSNAFAQTNPNNKRPSSTGGNLRSFSPATKTLKQQILPNNLKPQLIVTNQNGKKSGMRYPSPSINSSSSNPYQMSITQKNKRKL